MTISLTPKTRLFENARTKCIIFGETLRFRSKNLNKICVKIVQKVLEWPLQYVYFQKFSGERAPGPPTTFCILNMLQNNSSGKNTLENM